MTAQANEKVSVLDLEKSLKGFESIEHIHGSTFRNCSTIVIVPTRGAPHEPSLSARWVHEFQKMIAPMNQPRILMMACGHEVGKAYNTLIETILSRGLHHGWQYILTVEDDNLVPIDAHLRLIETIEEHKLDAVSGLYFTKGPVSMPMAFGDPEIFRKTGALEFRPRDVGEAYRRGERWMEVNGIAMGCALWRTSLFTEVKGPWFVTAPEMNGKTANMTQDLDFCVKARRAGKRFGVDLRVKVGHLDLATGEVY